MTTKNSTKKALVASLLSLLLCFTMLLGTTFAWFTDSVTSANNIITSGNLDVELYYQVDGQTDWTKVTETTNIFKENALWESGYTEVVKLKVVNEGSLALKYRLGVKVAEEDGSVNVNGDDFKLSQFIKFGIVDGAQNYTRDQAIAAVDASATALNQEYGSQITPLAAKNDTDSDEKIVTMVVYMPTTVGNDANHAKDAKVPTIKLGLNLFATQYTAEKDSFNDQYDAGANIPVEVSTADGLANVQAGDTVKLASDITLTEAITLPAGVTLNGNGKQINGTIVAGGDLTFEGHTKVTSFSASYYNRTITIGEGACLEITGTGRMSLAYGNVFNITGTLTDAKTADKTTVQPSLIIPAGISITGGNDAALNVTNAYVQLGSTTSKPGAANGTFNMNFTNSIVEFTKELGLYEPTGGMNPTFNVNVKDSVLTTPTKLCIAAPNSNVVIDNSTVTLGSYLRNSGTLTLKNGSVLTGATIQFGENGGNDGTINVDKSTLTVTASSTGHAFDGKGVGSINLTNGATATVDYYKDMTVTKDATSTFTGTEVQ